MATNEDLLKRLLDQQLHLSDVSLNSTAACKSALEKCAVKITELEDAVTTLNTRIEDEQLLSTAKILEKELRIAQLERALALNVIQGGGMGSPGGIGSGAQQITELKEALATVTAWHAEAVAQNESLQAEITKSAKEVSQLRAVQAREQELSAENKTFELQIKDLIDLQKVMEEEADTLKRGVKILEKQLKTQDSDFAKFFHMQKAQLKVLHDENEQLQLKSANLEAEMAKLTPELIPKWQELAQARAVTNQVSYHAIQLRAQSAEVDAVLYRNAGFELLAAVQVKTRLKNQSSTQGIHRMQTMQEEKWTAPPKEMAITRVRQRSIAIVRYLFEGQMSEWCEKAVINPLALNRDKGSIKWCCQVLKNVMDAHRWIRIFLFLSQAEGSSAYGQNLDHFLNRVSSTSTESILETIADYDSELDALLKALQSDAVSPGTSSDVGMELCEKLSKLYQEEIVFWQNSRNDVGTILKAVEENADTASLYFIINRLLIDLLACQVQHATVEDFIKINSTLISKVKTWISGNDPPITAHVTARPEVLDFDPLALHLNTMKLPEASMPPSGILTPVILKSAGSPLLQTSVEVNLGALILFTEIVGGVFDAKDSWSLVLSSHVSSCINDSLYQNAHTAMIEQTDMSRYSIDIINSASETINQLNELLLNLSLVSTSYDFQLSAKFALSLAEHISVPQRGRSSMMMIHNEDTRNLDNSTLTGGIGISTELAEEMNQVKKRLAFLEPQLEMLKTKEEDFKTFASSKDKLLSDLKVKEDLIHEKEGILEAVKKQLSEAKNESKRLQTIYDENRGKQSTTILVARNWAARELPKLRLLNQKLGMTIDELLINKMSHQLQSISISKISKPESSNSDLQMVANRVRELRTQATNLALHLVPRLTQFNGVNDALQVLVAHQMDVRKKSLALSSRLQRLRIIIDQMKQAKFGSSNVERKLTTVCNIHIGENNHDLSMLPEKIVLPNVTEFNKFLNQTLSVM